MLSHAQAKILIERIQNAEIAQFFEEIKEAGVQDAYLGKLEKEFISGRIQADFEERLQVFVYSIAETNFEVKQPHYDIFFSFSSKNQEEATKVVHTLRKTGLVVFFSTEDLQISAGTSFITAIQKALEDSKHFLLYCTPQSVTSPFVKYECETFLGHHITSQKAKRIFILRGADFRMNLLREVGFQNIQVSSIENILQVLGKKFPKDDLEERKEDYEEMFELFFADGIISERERKRLEKQKKLLGLSEEEIQEIESKVENEYYEKQEDIDRIVRIEEERKKQREANRIVRIEEERKKQKEADRLARLAQIEKLMPRMVKLGNFSIADSETTQALWTAVMGTNPSYFKGCPTCPVENVSWNDIQVFLQKLTQITGKNYRLPTEQEWEYAAKGGQNYEYAGSDNIDEVAWYWDNAGKKTHPVKQKKPNAYGLYDMTGNGVLIGTIVIRFIVFCVAVAGAVVRRFVVLLLVAATSLGFRTPTMVFVLSSSSSELISTVS